MAAIQFGYQNNSDQATLSGGSWETALPLANLKQRVQSKVARTTDAAEASTRIDIDMGGVDKIVRLVALFRHNLSTAATARVTAGTTAGASDVYDSGTIDVWPLFYIPQDLEWEADNWWLGTISPEEAAGYPLSLIHDAGRNVLARYWRVQISDVGNSDGYVEAGRLWMGPLWSPQVTYGLEAFLIWEPKSTEQKSLGGVLYFDEQPSARVFRLSLPALSSVETYGVMLEIQRSVGNAGEIVVIPDPDDRLRRFKRDLLGRLRQIDPLVQFASGYYRAGFEVEELL